MNITNQYAIEVAGKGYVQMRDGWAAFSISDEPSITDEYRTAQAWLKSVRSLYNGVKVDAEARIVVRKKVVSFADWVQDNTEEAVTAMMSHAKGGLAEGGGFR